MVNTTLCFILIFSLMLAASRVSSPSLRHGRRCLYSHLPDAKADQPGRELSEDRQTHDHTHRQRDAEWIITLKCRSHDALLDVPLNLLDEFDGEFTALLHRRQLFPAHFSLLERIPHQV